VVAMVLSLPASIPQHELLQGIVYGVVLVTLLGAASPARTLSRRARKLSGFTT
jgi:NhaP-type Na+/H+ or K+/H+ antiporter